MATGGALEALDSRPGAYIIQMARRKGFFRLALQTGSVSLKIETKFS